MNDIFEFEVEHVIVDSAPHKNRLNETWTFEYHFPETPQEQSEINLRCGIAPCERCGLATHGTAAHDFLYSECFPVERKL